VLIFLVMIYRRGVDSGFHWLTVLWVAPPIIAFAVSNVMTKSIWGHRHMVFTVWPFVLVFADSIWRLGRVARTVAVTLISGWVICAAVFHSTDDRKLPWDALTIEILKAEQSGAAKIPLYSVDPYLHFPIWFYMECLKTGQTGPIGPHIGKNDDVPALAARARAFDIIKSPNLDKAVEPHFWVGFTDSSWPDKNKTARQIIERRDVARVRITKREIVSMGRCCFRWSVPRQDRGWAVAYPERMHPQQPAPKINLSSTTDYREHYANSVQVRVSLWDFFLLFGTINQAGARRLFRFRISKAFSEPAAGQGAFERPAAERDAVRSRVRRNQTGAARERPGDSVTARAPQICRGHFLLRIRGDSLRDSPGVSEAAVSLGRDGAVRSHGAGSVSRGRVDRAFDPSQRASSWRRGDARAGVEDLRIFDSSGAADHARDRIGGVTVHVSSLRFACRALRPGAPAFAAAGLLMVAPMFFMQSILVHLDMPAMTLTAIALWLFLEGRLFACVAACTALVLVKETGITTPLAFGAWLWSPGEAAARRAVFSTARGGAGRVADRAASRDGIVDR
jgi:hypothetical protein